MLGLAYSRTSPRVERDARLLTHGSRSVGPREGRTMILTKAVRDRTGRSARRSVIAAVAGPVLVMSLFATASPGIAQTLIGFVQGNYAVPQSPPTVVNVTFTGAQTTGNLNVVAIGWNDSAATVTSVTDSRGNAYALAVAPTVMAGKASHAISYAGTFSVAPAGGTLVTVRFNVAAHFPDVRILEYRGLDALNPLVGGVGASGTSATSSSGTLTTSTPSVLLVAANVVETSTNNSGPNFTSRMITSPNGDIAEDRILTTAGTFGATAPTFGGYWVMQLAAFRAAGAGAPPDTTPPTVSITAPAANATVNGTVTVTATATDNVTVAGVQFKLDGVNLGAEVTGSSPYSVTWNTTGTTNGSHSLTAVARDNANLTTTSAVVPVTVSNGGGGNNTPPIVSVTAPLASATVAGTVTLAASASDDVGVAGVQFKVDGVNVGAEVTTLPYNVPWDTTSVADGPHTITAVARDTANATTTSSAVSVTVSNAGATSPSQIGRWSAPSAWPIVTIHTTLLANGQVLAWDGAAQNGAARLWNPSTNGFTAVLPPDNIFCAGHVLLADGRPLVVGGHLANFVGIPDANLFNPTTRVWSAAPPMLVGRWYPSAKLLPDGRVLVVSGSIDCQTCIADVPEIYDPVTNSWSQLPGASLDIPLYPHLFVLPDGRVLSAGAFEDVTPAQVLDLTTGTWSTVDPAVRDGHSSAMYAPGKILKSGTSANSDAPFKSAQPTTYVLDMNQPPSHWRQTQPMAFPRAYHTLTLLPEDRKSVV